MGYPSHHSLKQRGKKDHAEQLVHHTAGGGKVKKSTIAKAVHEHEAAMHPHHKPTKLHLATGGHVEGSHGKARLDRASGGRSTKSAGKGNHVNVIVAGGGPHPGMAPPGAPPPMAPPPRPMAPPPPAAAPGPPTGMLAGAGAPRPPMGPPIGAGVPMRAKGGRIKYPIDDGAGGGAGRLEKIKAYGKESNHGEGKAKGGRA